MEFAATIPPIGDVSGGDDNDRGAERFILLRLVVVLRQCRYGALVLRRPSWFIADEGRGACFFVEMGVVERDVKLQLQSVILNPL